MTYGPQHHHPGDVPSRVPPPGDDPSPILHTHWGELDEEDIRDRWHRHRHDPPVVLPDDDDDPTAYWIRLHEEALAEDERRS